MRVRPVNLLRATMFAGLLAGVTGRVAAQAAKSGSPEIDPSRVDLYGGYAYFHPQDSDVNNSPYTPLQPGTVGSVSGYFNRYLGIQLEGTFFPKGDGFRVVTGQTGPVVRYPFGRIVPFAHFLAGGARVSGPANQRDTWGWGVTGGVGVDYILPYLGDHIAVRPLQADFHYSQVDYGLSSGVGGASGGFGEIEAYRLSAGLVGRFGDASPGYGTMLGCAARPTSVYPGDPLTVSASTLNLKTNRRYVYQWTFAPSRVPGESETVQIDTAGLAPGDYTVNGRVVREKSTKIIATCSAVFTVKKVEPPTISCAADPATVLQGGQVTIRAMAVSPQNRAMTYAYRTTAGQVSGGGASATFSPGMADPGPVVVTCNVVDDLGHSETATTVVTILAPPVAVAPQARPLCSLRFDRDRKRPDRVDNEAKGCLDDIALTLNRESGAKLLIVGRHAPEETDGNAAERALNVREYLVQEKGIDASRIEMRIGGDSGRAVENTLIPEGGSYDPGAVSSFDASSVQRRGQAYGSGGNSKGVSARTARRRRTPVVQPTVP